MYRKIEDIPLNKTKNLALLLASMLLLASCGAKEPAAEDTPIIDMTQQITLGGDTAASEAIEAYDYMANDLTGYIKLGEYKGLSVTKASSVLTDEEFESWTHEKAKEIKEELIRNGIWRNEFGQPVFLYC